MAIVLADIETAITQIETSGQSFTVDGLAYNRGNLVALIDFRDRLKRAEERSSGARPLFRGFDFTTAAYTND